VEVVLWWAASESRFGLEPMDEVADDDLDDIENEQCQSKPRVRTVKVTATKAGNDGNSEGEANDDEGAGKEGLDSLVNLEPSSGRSPEVSPDQSTQGQKEKEPNDADDAVGDNHSVGLTQR